MNGATKTLGGEESEARQPPPQRKWRPEVAVLDRVLAVLLRRAEEGGLSARVVETLLRLGPALVRRRLIVQNARHGLEKMRRDALILEAAASSEWRVLFERLDENGLRPMVRTTYSVDVLFYADVTFQTLRYFPRAEEMLGSTLRWHNELAHQHGIGGEGGLRGAGDPIVDVGELVHEAAEFRGDLQRVWRDAERLRDSATPPMPPVQPPKVEKRESKPAPTRPEPGRFTDVTFYEGGLYPGDDPSGNRRLSDAEPLRTGAEYTLEVAIRLKRTGVECHLAPPNAVANPRQDRETLPIYVLVSSRSPTLVVHEAFTKIDWPYDTDSQRAFFRLSINAGDIPQGNARAALEVRLYHRLDLLDIVHVTVPVTTAPPGTPPSGPPAHLDWADNERELPAIDPDTPLRQLSIHVSRKNGGYLFEFVFARDDRDTIVVPVAREIGDDDLKTLLKRIRNFWTELAITNYASAMSVTNTTFATYVDRLAALGQQAWLLLFGSGYGPQAGASETLGTFLAHLTLSEGTHIQITYASALESFVFPWNVLYPPVSNGEAISPVEFWGARYQIEQVFKGSKQDRLADEPVNVAFALDRAFGNAELEATMFTDYAAASDGKLLVTDPISDEAALTKSLRVNPAAHLVYFFCHGFAPSAPELRADLVKLMRAEIDKLPAQQRAGPETLLRFFSLPGEEPWIFLGNSQIKESKIAGLQFFEQRMPIVFLNMCQSADLLPSMTSGLVRVFLKKSASAVVGTESPMTAVFAHAFAKRVLDDLFAGEDIGTALWNARRHFLSGTVRNPLGLAYTLYGRATVRLGRGALVTNRSAA